MNSDKCCSTKKCCCLWSLIIAIIVLPMILMPMMLGGCGKCSKARRMHCAKGMQKLHPYNQCLSIVLIDAYKHEGKNHENINYKEDVKFAHEICKDLQKPFKTTK